MFSVLCCQVWLCLYFVTGMKKWKNLCQFRTESSYQRTNLPLPIVLALCSCLMVYQVNFWLLPDTLYAGKKKILLGNEPHVLQNPWTICSPGSRNSFFSECFPALHKNLLYYHLFCTISRNAVMFFSVSFCSQNNLSDLVYIVAS